MGVLQLASMITSPPRAGTVSLSPTVCLENVIPELPQLGSKQRPTVGSTAHHLGLCKPCAHATKGCANGINCNYCHLCGPGELKRRQKNKRSLQRAIQQLPETISSSSRLACTT